MQQSQAKSFPSFYIVKFKSLDTYLSVLCCRNDADEPHAPTHLQSTNNVAAKVTDFGKTMVCTHIDQTLSACQSSLLHCRNYAPRYQAGKHFADLWWGRRQCQACRLWPVYLLLRPQAEVSGQGGELRLHGTRSHQAWLWLPSWSLQYRSRPLHHAMWARALLGWHRYARSLADLSLCTCLFLAVAKCSLGDTLHLWYIAYVAAHQYSL